MRPDKPRRNPVGWLRIAREGLFWRWRVLKTDCKLPARRGEAEARGSFVIRVGEIGYSTHGWRLAAA